MMSVILFCKGIDREDGVPTNIELFDGEIDFHGEHPTRIYRVERSGWVAYERRSFWLPRKDGVYAEINVYVNTTDTSHLSDEMILDALVDTFDSETI